MTSNVIRTATIALTLVAVTAAPAAAEYARGSGQRAEVEAPKAPLPVFSGENPVGAPRAEFAAAQTGMELIYQHRYGEAMEYFEEVGVDFPSSPLGPVGLAVVYQAVMWEDDSDAWARAYQSERADAATRFKAVRRARDGKSWNQFLEAVALALDAMYDIRLQKNLSAFNSAWEAMELVKQVHRDKPEFHDLQLAFGLYNYWRTAYTDRVKGLPSFGDHKAEGIAQMEDAIARGLLAPAPGRLALAYTWIDSKQDARAIAQLQEGFSRYPGNVLNSVLLARLQAKSKDYEGAKLTYEGLLAATPDSWEGWYRYGRLLSRMPAQKNKAKVAMGKAVNYARSGPHKAQSAYRFALLERSSRDYRGAIKWLEIAVEADPTFETARKRLDTVRAEKVKWDERERRPKPVREATPRTTISKG
jgi:tetratricopeptide (TPR) repeat protein